MNPVARIASTATVLILLLSVCAHAAVVSDYVLRAPLRNDEVVTTIMVPTGRTVMVFYTTHLVYSRKGNVNAEAPGSESDNSGEASFPYPAGQAYQVGVTQGERYTFITVQETGTLFVAFK